MVEGNGLGFERGGVEDKAAASSWRIRASGGVKRWHGSRGWPARGSAGRRRRRVRRAASETERGEGRGADRWARKRREGVKQLFNFEKSKRRCSRAQKFMKLFLEKEKITKNTMQQESLEKLL